MVKESNCKSYNKILLLLNSELAAKVLGVSPSSKYELMHEPDFLILRGQPHGGAKGKVHLVGGGAYGKCGMKYKENFFLLPNKIFLRARRGREKSRRNCL